MREGEVLFLELGVRLDKENPSLATDEGIMRLASDALERAYAALGPGFRPYVRGVTLRGKLRRAVRRRRRTAVAIVQNLQ